jgi:hypothetical protein
MNTPERTVNVTARNRTEDALPLNVAFIAALSQQLLEELGNLQSA